MVVAAIDSKTDAVVVVFIVGNLLLAGYALIKYSRSCDNCCWESKTVEQDNSSVE